MRRQLLALVAAALVAGAFAAQASASHAWGNYHWARTSNPFTLQVVDTTSSTWRPHVNAAVADWHQSAVLDLVTTTGNADRRCKGATGRVKVCNAAYGNNGWLGLATITITGGVHITSGTTKLNDSYFSSPTYNFPYKRQHVTCQEIGHDFGLGHQSEDFNVDLKTCMDYDRALDNEHPNSHDYQQLEQIYAQLDTTSTVGATSLGLAGSDNGQPVLVVREDRIVNSVITEKFEDGTMRITHVTWALDGPGKA